MDPEAAAEAFLNAGVDLAVRSIADEGAFYPFGMQMDPEGSVTMAVAQIPEDETPTQDEILQKLWESLLEDVAGGAQAIGVFLDVGLQPDVLEGFEDAIELAFEHKDGLAESFLVPYRTVDEQFELGPLFGVTRKARAFGD